MLDHGCSVSKCPQFYQKIKNKMLPRPYVGRYSGERGHPFLQEKWMISLEKSDEMFFMVSISDNPTIKYWYNLGTIMDTAEDNITKQFRIFDTCFTSLETIGGYLFTRHPKNINHVHKDSNDILSVIIVLGKNVHVGKKVFKWTGYE